MAATVEIHELNGAGQTATNKTAGSIRFKKTDDSSIDLNNVLSVPSSGTEYSMQKWLRMNVTGGSYTQITNPRFYTDTGNGYGTGCKLWAKTASAYTTPAIPSTSDDPPRLSGVDMADAFSYTSASPLDMDALNAGPFTSTGYKGDYLVLVFEVETTASQGIKTAETLTLAWDEV
jgi:hypothetical protein